MYSIKYFTKVLDTIEKMDKISTKIKKEYKEFKEQFRIAIKGNELFEKEEINKVKKDLTVLIHI